MAQRKDHTIAGADTLATDTNTMLIEGEGGIGIQVSGAGTYALAIEVTMAKPVDPLAVWSAIKVLDLNAQTQVGSITGPIVAYVDVPGFGAIRLRQTSGTGTPSSWLGETLDDA